ncbi:MAG: SNF2-related protein [Candidatus Sericytochromatia bacterium]|nr:SNF2-related protein [Candidatus Sericytochromatia bacterium]
MLERFEWLDLRPEAGSNKVQSPAGEIASRPIPAAIRDEPPHPVSPALALPTRIDTVPVATGWPQESGQLFRLRHVADSLRVHTGFEHLLCLNACHIEHHPHQQAVALRVLGQMRGRAILADEVGLGKTIEAGLILKELIVRGLAHRVLVLAPAALTWQWLEELEQKFDERFRVVRKQSDWSGSRLIASLDLAKQPRHAALALAQAFDVVIVDEAHKLKSRQTQAHQLVSRLNKRYLLLLTATPVMNDLSELYALVNLLAEGELGTPRTFEATYMDGGDPRAPLNEDDLRKRLAGVMVRNRRDSVGLRLPPRRAGIYHLVFPPDEARLYSELTAFIREELRSHPDQGHLRLTLSVLQRGLTSTPAAVAGTLEALIDDEALEPEICGRLAGYAAMARGIPVGRKMQAVVECLQREPDSQMLVFTEFRRSQVVLADFLRSQGYDVVVFHGSLSAEQRTQAVAEFSRGARVMISTESGQEGLNLQFCHTLLNFDLPWNPMRVEQRIGRLHRLGQIHPVTIINLAFENTIEMALLELLGTKIRLFELVVGELDVILGDWEQRKSFEDWVLDSWASASSDEEWSDTMLSAAERGLLARQRYEGMREAGHRLVAPGGWGRLL